MSCTGKMATITLNAVKCNLTELTTKRACVPLEVSGVDTFVHVSEFHVFVDCSMAYKQAWRTNRRHSLHFIAWQLIAQAVLLPPPFPTSFHCFYSVTGACSSCCVGAHGWLARICQPWEQSSSRSWLPIVEAPGCFRPPTSILVMQLLIDILIVLALPFLLAMKRNFTMVQ